MGSKSYPAILCLIISLETLSLWKRVIAVQRSVCALRVCAVDNAIPIKSWFEDPTDTALLNLLPVLDCLRFTHDVRSILSRNLVHAPPVMPQALLQPPAHMLGNAPAPVALGNAQTQTHTHAHIALAHPSAALSMHPNSIVTQVARS